MSFYLHTNNLGKCALLFKLAEDVFREGSFDFGSSHLSAIMQQGKGPSVVPLLKMPPLGVFFVSTAFNTTFAANTLGTYYTEKLLAI